MNIPAWNWTGFLRQLRTDGKTLFWCKDCRKYTAIGYPDGMRCEAHNVVRFIAGK